MTNTAQELDEYIAKNKEKDKEKILIRNEYKHMLLTYVDKHCKRGTFSPNTYDSFLEIITQAENEVGIKS